MCCAYPWGLLGFYHGVEGGERTRGDAFVNGGVSWDGNGGGESAYGIKEWRICVFRGGRCG
ncbi:hypothetical protein [Bartonella grahamii]|uniref:hypothetical protein n=1 Tax=Bartonella grahamii TaxID=33045 RepID=UPI002E7B58D9|nr:hypothetical protein [Bartonella grahamii]